MHARTGGATPSSTRSTSAASPTVTATAWATSPASGPSCPTSRISESTRSGSTRGTRPRWPTPATTSRTTGRSSPGSAPSRRPRRCSPRPTSTGLRVLLDIVPNHTSDRHPWFQEALAAGPGSRERDRYVFRPGRGADGDAAAELLAERVRRAGVGAGDRARRVAGGVVPPPVRPRAARRQLGAPRRVVGLRGDAALLVRPRRRRLPHRRRALADQAGGAPGRRRPRVAAAPGRGGRCPAPFSVAAAPVLGPRRGARGLPRLAQDRGLLRPAPGLRGGGVGRRAGAAGPLPARRTSCTRPSTSPTSRRPGTRATSGT